MISDFKIPAEKKLLNIQKVEMPKNMPKIQGDISEELQKVIVEQFPESFGQVNKKEQEPSAPDKGLFSAVVEKAGPSGVDSQKDLKLSTKKTLEDMKKDAYDKVKVSEEDIDRFFESIIDDEPYCDIFTALKGNLVVKFRTRTSGEQNEIIRKISEVDPKSGAHLESLLAIYNLAFSVVEVRTKKKTVLYDDGLLDDRVKKLNMYTHKYTILIQGLFDFDTKVDKLKELALEENF